MQFKASHSVVFVVVELVVLVAVVFGVVVFGVVVPGRGLPPLLGTGQTISVMDISISTMVIMHPRLEVSPKIDTAFLILICYNYH